MSETSKQQFEFDRLLNLKETPCEFRSSLEIGGRSIDPIKILQDFINLIDGVRIDFSDDEKGFPEGQNFSIGIVTKYEMRKRAGEWGEKREPTPEEIDAAIKENHNNPDFDPQNIFGRRDGLIADFQGYTEKNILISAIEIKIGSHFSYVDLPKLVRQIQNLHNDFIKTPKVGDLETSRLREISDYILETAEVMAANYYFWASKIEELNQEKKIPAFTNYATKLRDIAQDFAPETSVLSKSRKWLDNLEKPLEAKAQSIINEPRKELKKNDVVEKTDKRMKWNGLRKTLPQRMNGNEEEQTKLIDALDRLIAKSVRKSLTESFEQIVFERGEKEIWRQSDIPEIFYKTFSSVEYDRLFFYLFPTKWQTIEDAQRDLAEANKSGDTEKIAMLQTKIAKVLVEILYSEKFFFYKDAQFNLDGISKEKLVNCMTRSQILHLLCQKIMGVGTLGVTITSHFFSCLPLANGKMLSLNGIPKETDLKNQAGSQEVQGQFYQVGIHEKMYRSSIWDWQGGFYYQEGKYKKAIFCYQKAIELNLNNPHYYSNLGNAFNADGNLKGAIDSHQKAIKLNPKDPNHYYNIGIALRDDGNIENAKEAYLKAVELTENNNAWFLTGLANFYYYNINNKPEALKYYKLALDAMNAGSPNFKDKKWIQDKILELENSVKK